MQPDRKEKIGRHVVEEYYWASKMVVYIDNCLTDETFNVACLRLKIENANTSAKEEPSNALQSRTVSGITKLLFM